MASILQNAATTVRRAGIVARAWGSYLLDRPPGTMPVILAFVTDRCNLRCRMCGVHELANREGRIAELSTEEWKAVIDSAAVLRTLILSIGGGEPLLRNDLCDLVAYATAKGIRVHLCSNGTILTEERVRALSRAGLSTLSVSVESPDAGVHDRMRGEGTHRKVLEGIRILRETAPDIRIGISVVLCALNCRDMWKMVPFAESLGVDQIKFAPIHTNLLHRCKRGEAFDSLVFQRDDLPALKREVAELKRVALASRLETTSPMFFAGITRLYRNESHFRCYAGHIVCAINPIGQVTPCCDMDGGPSVRERPLETILRSPAFTALRHSVRRCSRACWDTTNTELSLRLTGRGVILGLGQTMRDLDFYFKRRPR